MHNVRCLQDTKIKIGRRAGAGCAAGRTNEGSAGPAPRTNHRPRLRCAPGGAELGARSYGREEETRAELNIKLGETLCAVCNGFG